MHRGFRHIVGQHRAQLLQLFYKRANALIKLERPAFDHPELLLRFRQAALGAQDRRLLRRGHLAQVRQSRAVEGLVRVLQLARAPAYLVLPVDTPVLLEPLPRADDFIACIVEERPRLGQLATQTRPKRLDGVGGCDVGAGPG